MGRIADEKRTHVHPEKDERKPKEARQNFTVSSKEKGVIELIRAREHGELKIMIRKNEPVMAEDKLKDITL